MNRDDIRETLKATISHMSVSEFAKLFINEISAIEEFFKLCNGVKAGNTISLLFNPHRLNIVTEAAVERTSAPMSIYQSLSDKGNSDYTEKIDGLARLFLYNMEHGVTNSFYCAVQRGYNGVAYVNEFPPYVARSIYLQYSKSKNLRILDPCAGWGGRMIGAASIPNTYYVACEPSTETYCGLIKLGDWLHKLQPTFQYKIYNIPYEDFICDEQFDIALTSPPYYNTEHYSEEETNSLNRYKSYDSWVDGFFKPLILNTVKCLNLNSVFILNIGDRKYPLSNSLKMICDYEGIYNERIHDYLSGNGDGKEKFYCLSKSYILSNKPKKLF